MVDPDTLPLAPADWPVYRIISARFPQIHLFDRVASPEQWDVLYAVESLTNQRLREEVGDIRLIPPEDRVFGEGASWIMAAFTHPPKRGQGGRFNGTFGAFYCAPHEATAIAETRYHRARFLRESRIRRTRFQMRVLRAHLGPTSLHDLRGLRDRRIYHPDDYTASQALGAAMRSRKSTGLYYRSVRCDGECVAVLRPRALSNAVHRYYLTYTFADGEIVRVTRARAPAGSEGPTGSRETAGPEEPAGSGEPGYGADR